MRRSCNLYGAFAALLLALFATFSQPRAGELYPNVVVTVPALVPYVDALLNGFGHAQNLLNPGQDAHEFTLSGQQREMLAHADVIILSDRSMAPQIDKLLAGEAKRGADVVSLITLPGAEPLPYATQNPWLDVLKAAQKPSDAKKKSSEPAEEEDETKDKNGNILTDPHLWLDPVRMADLAEPLAEIIAEKSPSNRATLLENAKRLSDHLRLDVTPAIQRMLKPSSAPEVTVSKPEYPFITYHAGYQYFMARFGLRNPGEITQRPEEFFGAQALHNVMESAQNVKIHCLISETDTPLVKHVASASGARIITLSPENPVSKSDITSDSWAQNDYDRLLQKTAESFAGCMK